MQTQAVFHNPLLKDGFAQAPNAIMKTKVLSLQAKCLYVLLLSYAWADTSCFPSQGTMADDLNVSDRYIRTLLKELEREQFIQIERQGLNKPNIYHFLDFYATRKDLFSERNNSSGPDRKKRSSQRRKHDSGLERNGSSGDKYSAEEHSITKSDYKLLEIRKQAFFNNIGRYPSKKIMENWKKKLRRGESLF